LGKALQEYLTFWKEAYLRDDPWEAVKELDGKWPDGLREALGEYALLPPEPFYGFYKDLDDESRKQDVLVLLINPGRVTDPSLLAPRWLKFHRRRYLEWTREDYLLECGVHDHPGETRHQEQCGCPLNELYEKPGEGCRWRRQRFAQLRNNVGWGNLRFLHTMEYSFYHSDKWSDLAPYHPWIRERATTRLAMAALREIAEEKLVSRIVTIGVDSKEVLSLEPGVKLSSQETFYTERGRYSHRLYQFKVGDEALPIVTYISGSGSIQFPSEERAVIALNALTEKLRTESEVTTEQVEQPTLLNNTKVVLNDGKPCDTAKSYMQKIIQRLGLPSGEYKQHGPLSGDGKFIYTHFAREGDPVWDIKYCMMKIRTYCNREPLSTRVEFGFSQDKANLTNYQKEYLRGVIHHYALLHGLTELRTFPDKQFYNVYYEFSGDPEWVIQNTTNFFRELLKAVEGFIETIHHR
jgi:hypothetical protein